MDDENSELLKFRVTLQELAVDSQRSYDKSLLTLSGGALGLSFVFLDKIVGGETPMCISVLITSWSLWAISICSVLISFYFSRLALERAVEQIDDGKAYSEILGGKFDYVTEVLNIISGSSFILGVVSMIIFISKNI